MNQYTVIIRKEHCEGARYMNVEDCPLCRAIREQLPDFPLKFVGGVNVEDTDNQQWFFGSYVWNISVMHEILAGLIIERPVTFTKHTEI